MDLTNVTFPLFSYEIERGKIREFAKAIGDHNPIYYDLDAARNAGFRDIPMPPTFATVMEMWAGADFEQLVDRLQLDPLKVLHGEQAYRYLGDICAGNTLHGKTKVISAKEKAGMKFITLETTYTNQDQQVVLIATSVLIERQ